MSDRLKSNPDGISSSDRLQKIARLEEALTKMDVDNRWLIMRVEELQISNSLHKEAAFQSQNKAIELAQKLDVLEGVRKAAEELRDRLFPRYLELDITEQIPEWSKLNESLEAVKEV